MGAINQGFQGNGKIVVHIQDLHCNYEVQKNIANIIQHLVKKHGLKLVGEEGAFHTVDTSPISAFPIRKVREEVSDYFVKQGKITGAEHYAAISGGAIQLEGIETPELYAAGQKAVRSFLNAESQGYCYDLRDILDELKAALYNPRLKQFDARRTAWREGSLDLLKYCVHLYTSARKLKPEVGAYPQLTRFVSQNQNFFSLEINPDRLFQELDKLDTVIRQQLYTSEPQRELDILYRRLDIVENRYIGMKSRGCYETPAGTIMLKAHRAMESLTLDREVMHLKDELMPRYAKLIYNGYWWSPEREMLQAMIDLSQQTVNGCVRLKLYKGGIMVVGRKSENNSLFDEDIATFEDDAGAYDQTDATGFIRLNALRLRIAAGKKGL